MTTHNTREGIEEILRKFKTTIMWETEHEEGLLMSNHDALEWLRVQLLSLELTLHQELQKARVTKIEVLNGGAKIIIDGKKLLHGIHKRKNPDLYEYDLLNN